MSKPESITIDDVKYVRADSVPKPIENVAGVNWRSRRSKWQAQISISDRTQYLGLFAKHGDAVAARRAAELSLQAYG